MRDLRDARLCAINTATLGFQAPIGAVIDAVARAGFGGLAPWRREIEGGNVAVIAKRIRHLKPIPKSQVFLLWLENLTASFFPFYSFSDHYIIEMQKK